MTAFGVTHAVVQKGDEKTLCGVPVQEGNSLLPRHYKHVSCGRCLRTMRKEQRVFAAAQRREKEAAR